MAQLTRAARIRVYRAFYLRIFKCGLFIVLVFEELGLGFISRTFFGFSLVGFTIYLAFCFLLYAIFIFYYLAYREDRLVFDLLNFQVGFWLQRVYRFLASLIFLDAFYFTIGVFSSLTDMPSQTLVGLIAGTVYVLDIFGTFKFIRFSILYDGVRLHWFDAV